MIHKLLITAALIVQLPGGFKIIQDHPSVRVQYDCPDGAWCQLGTVPLPPGYQFSNANFYCAASQYGTIVTPIAPVCSPTSNHSFQLYFHNDTGADIPYGQAFSLETHAEGI